MKALDDKNGKGKQVLRLPESEPDQENDAGLYGYVWFSQEQVRFACSSPASLEYKLELSSDPTELLITTELLSTITSPPHTSSTSPRALLFSLASLGSSPFPSCKTSRCERWNGRKCLPEHRCLVRRLSSLLSVISLISDLSILQA